jgi:hypothetical protein
MEQIPTIVIVSIALALIAPVVYSVSMVQGVSKPARMTRFIVWLAATISFVSLWADGSQGAIWIAGVFAIRNAFLLIMSFRYGLGGWTSIDKVCLVLAIIGLVGWQVFGDPLIALIFAIFADFVGFIPAFIKTYRLPKSEGPWFYYIETIAVLLNIIFIGAWSVDLLFPGYILLSNVIMIGLIYKIPQFVFTKIQS